MKTLEIDKLNYTEFTTEAAANEAIKVITNLTGIKERQNTIHTDFITLGKQILLDTGISLYAIWIKKTFNKDDKKVFIISLQTEFVFSFTIAEFINNAVNEERLILTEDIKDKLTLVNS